MEAVQTSTSSASSLNYSYQKVNYQYQSLVISATLLGADESDSVSFSSTELNKALGLTAEEIITKLNEKLKGVLPEGLASVKPEDATPEATADRIVKSITGLFEIFAKSKPGLEDEQRLDEFMKQARAGVEQGYADAYEMLQGLGAFNFDGVEDGVKQTKLLIEKKLAEFESAQRERLGLGTAIQGDVADLTSQGVVLQAGVGVSQASKLGVVA